MTQDSVTIHSLVMGFGHRARQGKDVVAKAILDTRGIDYDRPGEEEGLYDIRLYSFAKELKDEVNRYFELLRKQGESILGTWLHIFKMLRNEGAPLKASGEFLKIPEWVVMEPDPDMNDPLCPYGKYRTLLQWYGSEYRRNNFGENYWVERAAARLATEKPEIAIFSDMRFPNEFEFVKQYGITIKVQRPGTTSPNSHISEEALAHVPDSEWDVIFTNDGTLEETKAKAVMMFDSLMEQQR